MNSLTNSIRKQSLISVPEGEDSDPDEPLLSGSGEVSKECTVSELQGWAEVLSKWRTNLSQRPKQLQRLVKKGIPEALRGEVWQLLACCQDDESLIDYYRILITQETPYESVIRKDTSRTFPANEHFKESGSSGQDSIYRLCKAYSIHDKEIGYCQGLTFMTAALLLHMPEEQAFLLLVSIMRNYGVRNLFRRGFENLQLRFYQLERLMEEIIPDLYQHFVSIGVEAHMFASQWFLTLFTAKFPLHVVFYILDLFLLQGMETIFQVALALLLLSKKELISTDFEGVLKHFRVHLPKKYRIDENAKILLQTAVSIKFKKLDNYEKDFFRLKEERVDPERLKDDIKKLLESNIRLEQENDDLARDLVYSKIELRRQLDEAEDQIDLLNKELSSIKSAMIELEEEKKRLDEENSQVKEVCRRELFRTESEIKRNSKIISDYKAICSQLSKRLENQQRSSQPDLTKLLEQIKVCTDIEQCSSLVEELRDQCQISSDDLVQNGEDHIESDVKREVKIEVNVKTHIRELELELARTKLALVEAECQNQELIHQLINAQAEVQASKNSWFNKTLTSLREATRKEFKEKEKEKDKERDKDC